MQNFSARILSRKVVGRKMLRIHKILLQMDQHGGQTASLSSPGPVMSSSLHRRSLQDVEALGLFHHGRGVGRHLTRQSSSTDDSRRRSSANLHNASSVTHLASSIPGRTFSFFFSEFPKHFTSLQNQNNFKT